MLKERTQQIPIEDKMPLASLRARRVGLTQKQVAEDLGVSRELISKWENNSEDISFSMMQRFADYYHFPVDFIFFGKMSALNDKLSKLDA